MSVLPVESDTAQVSALPVVRSKVPAVYVGKVTLDSVGLRVDPSCLRLDPEETLLRWTSEACLVVPIGA